MMSGDRKSMGEHNMPLGVERRAGLSSEVAPCFVFLLPKTLPISLGSSSLPTEPYRRRV